MSPKTLLAVLAHPDDESFGVGGTLALYASRGVDVYLVCATRGEVGQADEEHLKGFASTGDMREAELRCGVHAPLDPETARRLRAEGVEPTPNRHNCSGKHTGMLALARFLGDPEVGPLGRAIPAPAGRRV